LDYTPINLRISNKLRTVSTKNKLLPKNTHKNNKRFIFILEKYFFSIEPIAQLNKNTIPKEKY